MASNGPNVTHMRTDPTRPLSYKHAIEQKSPSTGQGTETQNNSLSESHAELQTASVSHKGTKNNSPFCFQPKTSQKEANPVLQRGRESQPQTARSQTSQWPPDANYTQRNARALIRLAVFTHPVIIHSGTQYSSQSALFYTAHFGKCSEYTD